MLSSRKIVWSFGRGGLLTAVFIAATLVAVSAAKADTYYWNNAAANWNVGGDWYDNNLATTGVVPGSADTAYIDNGGAVTISDAESIGTLYISASGGSYPGNGTLNLNSGGTLSVGSGGILNGGGTPTFNLGGGTLKAAAGFSSSVGATLTAATTSTLNTQNYVVTLSGPISGTGSLSIAGRPAAP